MIRVTRKRLVVTALLLLFLAGGLVVAWRVCDWPPPRLILKYGLPPAGGPTGRRMTVEGVAFIELSPGYTQMGLSDDTTAEGGDLIGRISAVFGLPWGTKPRAGLHGPPRWTEIDRAVWISVAEITRAQYERRRPDHQRPSFPRGRDVPVVWVTWHEALSFCRYLNRFQSEFSFRLPTEAEWEYAARAGTRGAPEDDDPQADSLGHAWHAGNSGMRLHETRAEVPNAWGLYDMLGNAAEWCMDEMESVEPDVPDEFWAGFRKYRGGSFLTDQSKLSPSRSHRKPALDSTRTVGFRPVAIRRTGSAESR